MDILSMILVGVTVGAVALALARFGLLIFLALAGRAAANRVHP